MWYALPKARKRATANVLTSQDPVIRIWVSVLGELKRVAERGDTDNETRILGQRVLRDIQGAL